MLAFITATRPSSEPSNEAATTTLPPGLSAVSTELIDLTSPTGAEPTTTAWDAVPFDWPGRINDILPFNISLFAVGYEEEGAMAWLSSAGSDWRAVPRFERPDNPTSSVDHAVVWNGTVVALGSVGDEVGLWTARALSHWFYQGTVPEMGDWLPQGLAATDRLLAISEKEGHYQGWISEDGLTWAQLGDVSALDEVAVTSLVGIGGWFYAAGQERNAEAQRAVIYRSQDGTEWERTKGLGDGSLSEYGGAVEDLTATPEGLMAVGYDNAQMALWKSSDGDSWRRVATDDMALRAMSATVELRSTNGAGEALIVVDNQERRLVEGSRVLTDAGPIRVSAVNAEGVVLELADGSFVGLEPDLGAYSFDFEGFPQGITAQGPRIVATGAVGVYGPSTPAVWTSDDGGQTWNVEFTEPGSEGWAHAAAITGANIAIIGGSGPDDPQAWHTTWNTQRAEDAGMELVEAFFDAVQQRNTDALVALLPNEPARFRIPSLAGAELPWWDESTALLDREAVTSTLEYLEALRTRIDLGECRTRMLLREVDSLRVTCGFAVESDLLATYSNEDYEGTAEIVVENGGIQRVDLTSVPSAQVWRMLTTGLGSTDPTTQALLDDPDTAPLDPVFTAESAPIHLRATEEFIAGLLRPGDTRIVETNLGTMEWSWLDPVPIPVYLISWITSFEGGFVAVGQGEPERWTEETTLWTSQDGVAWEPMAVPPNVTGMWNLQRFRDGLIAQAWEQERSFLVIYDGSDWGELELPSFESAQYFDVRDLATSGDHTLVVTVGWNEGYEAGPDAHQAWLIGPDNVPRQTNLPIGFWDSNESIGLVGSDEGFVLGTAQNGSPRSMRIWFSSDGYEWDEIAATTSIENAVYVWHLQRHSNRYFVVGEGAETNCATIDDDGSFCEQLVGLWSSPDGADWERVFTASGEPVGAYEIGSGPMGLVAMAYSDRPLPRPLYLSPDGSTWERAGNLALLYPDAEWWWASVPAVGNDTILFPGSAFRATGGGVEEDTSFLVVGRLVDS